MAGLTLTPVSGLNGIAARTQNDYYYGVSRKESSRSGLRGAIANDGWNPYLELGALTIISPVTGAYMGTALHTPATVG